MKLFFRVFNVLACVAFSGAISAQDSPDSVTRGTKQFQKKVLVSGLQGPWELTWGPDNMLWVTERTGEARYAHRPGHRRTKCCDHHRRGFRPRRSGRTPGYGIASGTVEGNRQRLCVRRIHIHRQKERTASGCGRSGKPVPISIRQDRAPFLQCGESNLVRPGEPYYGIAGR